MIKETFLDRLILESTELTDKIVKLENFLGEEGAKTVKSVSKYQRDLLEIQINIMKSYNNILLCRITDLNK